MRDDTIVVFEYPIGITKAKIDISGNAYFSKIYDINNPSYYVDPFSTNRFNVIKPNLIEGGVIRSTADCDFLRWDTFRLILIVQTVTFMLS